MMADAATGPSAVAVRIYCTVDDMSEGRSLVRTVTATLNDRGALNVAILRGERGFGRARRVHDIEAVDSGMNHPAVIEWVDTAVSFRRIWPHVRQLVMRQLVTVESVALVGERLKAVS